jgi:hypothetical protein
MTTVVDIMGQVLTAMAVKLTKLFVILAFEVYFCQIAFIHLKHYD